MEKKEAMKVMLNKAWEQVENKEELLETIAKKEPNFNEEQKLAFAKLFAYTQLSKAEKGVHKPYLEGRDQDNSKKGVSEAGFRTRLGSKLNARHTDNRVISDSDRKKQFKQKAIESSKNKHREVISEQKTMPKPNLPKSEMAKEEKGVHKPVYMAGKKTGVSDLGARFSGGKPSKELKEYAVKEHKKVLAEQKQMPKPNLPKSEPMAKAKVDQGKSLSEKLKARRDRNERSQLGFPDSPKGQKTQGSPKETIGGVHKTPFKSAPGMSNAGDALAHKNKNRAKANHEQVISEQKQMPKPNLPKSELAKAKVEEMKLDLKKKPKWQNNMPFENNTPKSKKISWNHDKEKRSIEGSFEGKKFKIDNVNAHIAQDTIKRHLNSPDGKTPHEKAMGKTEITKEEKGVHQPVFGKYPTGKKGGKKTTLEGLSEAGAQLNVYNANKAANWVNKEKSKEAHKKILSEQKTMPKPNLPKSENMMKGKSTISKPSEPAPNYDAKTWDKPKKSLQDHIKEQKPSYDSKHPKIDIYHKGNYSHSTNWHPTVKSALERHLKENPSHDPKDVKASISKK